MACMKTNLSVNLSAGFFCRGVIILKICGASIVKITNPSKIMICSDPPEATEAAQFNNKILSAISSFVKLGNKNQSFALVACFF